MVAIENRETEPMDEKDDQSKVSGDVQDSSEEKQGLISDDDPTFLVRPEVLKGRLIGDEHVRYEISRQSAFKRISAGLLEATEVTQAPHGTLERIKRLLIGSPLATAQQEQERLSKFKALAVLSSDAISSVAYATEAILITIVAAGSGNLGLTLPISFAIVALLAIVAISYRQTIPAYPNGGGSYILAMDNLGTLPGLVAAASLLIDYVLTASVFISLVGDSKVIKTPIAAFSPTRQPS